MTACTCVEPRTQSDGMRLKPSSLCIVSDVFVLSIVVYVQINYVNPLLSLDAYFVFSDY